jgi:8-oxo-dGTP diphosphatase
VGRVAGGIERGSCHSAPPRGLAPFAAVEPLLVIAAAVTGPRGLLLVSKRAAPDLFYLPGGKPDPGETPLDALRREIDEELGVALTGAEPFAEVDGTADIEQQPMRLVVYRAQLVGTPVPAAELAAMRWWPGDGEIAIASAIIGEVIPRLRAAGHLAA